VDLFGLLRQSGIGFDARVRIVDLSLAGACFELASFTAVEPRTTFLLEINASMLWDPLSLRGEIVWATPPTDRAPGRAGVLFHHQETASLFALFELLGSEPSE